MSDLDVSVVIPFANDFPAIYFTLNNLAATLVESKLTHEFIVVVNGTPAENFEEARKSILDPTNDFGKYHRLTIIHNDIQSNGLAANAGAAVATGKYLLMTDAHVIVQPNLFTECIKVMEANPDAGLVHAPITWTGIPYVKDPDGRFLFVNSKRCYQYLYRTFDATGDWYLSRHFHGTYNHKLISPDPYPIAGCGHGLYMMRRATWEVLGGYHPAQRAYGGREAFLTFKAWLLGYRNFTVPTTNHIHYNGRRHYPWTNDLWMKNNLMQAYSIGGDKWLDIIYTNFKKKPGVKVPIIERLRNEAVEESKEQRAFVLKNQHCEFDELFKLWDSAGVFF